MPVDDWYPNTNEGEREMFGAIFDNIDEVDETLQMEPDKKTRLKAMAQCFNAYYDNLSHNRAAVKAEGTGFTTLMKGKKGIDPMPAKTDFNELTLPAGDFVGMEAEMRDMRGYMKGLFTWSENMGDILRINGKSVKPPPPGEKSPTLDFGKIDGNLVPVRAKKEGEDGIEYQWRVAGENIFQPLVNSGDAETVLEIPVEAGKAIKVEIRAIFLRKFKRVGVWSSITTLSVSG